MGQVGWKDTNSFCRQAIHRGIQIVIMNLGWFFMAKIFLWDPEERAMIEIQSCMLHGGPATHVLYIKMHSESLLLHWGWYQRKHVYSRAHTMESKLFLWNFNGNLSRAMGVRNFKHGQFSWLSKLRRLLIALKHATQIREAKSLYHFVDDKLYCSQENFKN